MQSYNTLIVALVIIVALVLILFINRKNQKDKKTLNPDSENAVEETRGDESRNADKT